METANFPRLMISAAHKSSGKTTVSLGILHHLASKGERVTSFKKGPDYIDPMWHRLASGSECYNLDPYLMGADACRDSFLKNANKIGLSIIEGNHGLHDGMALDGSDSSAGLADLLKTPVLLVVDSRKLNRGVAAIVLGMQTMPPNVNIAGVILNQVHSARQAEKQKKATEQFCKVPVLGAIPVDKELVIPERHLGLTTVGETADAMKFVQGAAERVAQYCDMTAIRSLFYEAPSLTVSEIAKAKPDKSLQVKIGVFRDASFCFYYPENLNALRDSGAELVFIDSFQTKALPDVDGLYLGGGFPESFFDILSGNTGLLKDVRDRVESGMPTYAECGGLIYLSRTAAYEGKTHSLVGLLPIDIEFQRRPAGHGYLDLRSRTDSHWYKKDEQIRAHEFHYSRPGASSGQCTYQFDVMRGYGVTGESDGALYKNLFASFAHLHAVGNPKWAERFVSLATQFKVSGSVQVKD